ncbi:MAG: hypothetical protein IJT73_01330 [Selenomonadaceae bacterium]|nr:hypothetical protein [Selenomonadaceae bacterium]
MVEEQIELMKTVRESLKRVLDSNNSICAHAGDLATYRINLSDLALEFPNQETLALALELMNMIYYAEQQKKFYWINDVEKLTVTSLRFTDLSAVYKK